MKMMLNAIALGLAAGVLLVANGRAQDGGNREGQPTQGQAKAQSAKDEVVPEKVVSEKEAVKQLIGSYRIVSGQTSGEQVLPERLADVTVRITAETITTYDGDKQQRFSATYRLETQQRPWRIKMQTSSTPATTGATPARGSAAPANQAASASEGLVELTEKGAKLIYALPGGQAPRSFTSAARQQLFVLERLKEPAAEKAEAETPATETPATEKPKT